MPQDSLILNSLGIPPVQSGGNRFRPPEADGHTARGATVDRLAPAHGGAQLFRPTDENGQGDAGDGAGSPVTSTRNQS